MDVIDRRTKRWFVHELGLALRYLYDPFELRRTALIAVVAADEGYDLASALKEMLIEAIEALKPDDAIPRHANAWRFYSVLVQRYVEGFTPSDIANSLALSTRQLRRVHAHALAALADALLAREDVASRLPAAAQGLATQHTGDADRWREDEIAHIGRTYPSQLVDAAEVVESAVRIARPLLDRRRLQVDIQVGEDTPMLAVQATSVRHALLNILTTMSHALEGGTITVRGEAEDDTVSLCLELRNGSSFAVGGAIDPDESLKVARELIDASGGTLEAETSSDGALLSVRMCVRADAQMTVLVVDDNVDALQLYERYLAKTRYRFKGVSNPLEAVDVAERVKPRAVVLDLMFPETDGWELLGRLREHPQLGGVPAIVCSILPESDLASALGAAAFLRKPVSRSALLRELDRHLVPACPPPG